MIKQNSSNFPLQFSAESRRGAALASFSRGWYSWHPAPEVEKVFFTQLSLLLWFSAALGAALFTTQWPASTGFSVQFLPSIDGSSLEYWLEGHSSDERFSSLVSDYSYSYLHFLPSFFFFRFSFVDFFIFLFSIASAQPLIGRYFYTSIALAPSSTFVQVIFLLSFFFFLFLSFSSSVFSFSYFFLLHQSGLPYVRQISTIHYND